MHQNHESIIQEHGMRIVYMQHLSTSTLANASLLEANLSLTSGTTSQVLHRHEVLLARLHKVPALQLRGVAGPAPALCSRAGLLPSGTSSSYCSVCTTRTCCSVEATPHRLPTCDAPIPVVLCDQDGRCFCHRVCTLAHRTVRKGAPETQTFILFAALGGGELFLRALQCHTGCQVGNAKKNLPRTVIVCDVDGRSLCPIPSHVRAERHICCIVRRIEGEKKLCTARARRKKTSCLVPHWGVD
jgi:hypothetical protein